MILMPLCRLRRIIPLDCAVTRIPQQFTPVLLFLLLCVSLAQGQERKSLTAFSMSAAQATIEHSIDSEQFFRTEHIGTYQLGGITRPMAVILDRQKGDWILLGERNPNNAILTLDDLAVALRARYFFPADDPGVTIVPQFDTQSNPTGFSKTSMAPRLPIQFFAGVEGTRFGKVCFDADWLLKRVSVNREDLGVRELETLYDLVEKDFQSSNHAISPKILSRFWFMPTVNRVNVVDDVVLLEKFSMGVFTEIMYAEVNGRPVTDLDGFLYEPSEGFSRSFSNIYATAAKKNETLNLLLGITRLASLAKGLLQEEDPVDIRYWLKEYPVEKIETPMDVPMQYVEDRKSGFSVSGGVTLMTLATRIKGGDAGALRELVITTRPSPDAATWTFEIVMKDGQVTGVNMPADLSDPNRIASLCQHAWFLYQKGRYESALEALDSAFEKAPEFAYEGLWMKAVVLREYGLATAVSRGSSHSLAEYRLELATSMFRKSIAINPEFAPAHFELGVTLGAFGDHNAAIESLKRTIEIDQDYTPAYFKLGVEYASLGDREQCRDYLDKFLTKEPDGPLSDEASTLLTRMKTDVSSGKRQFRDTHLGLSFSYPNDWVVLKRDEIAEKSKGMIGSDNPNLQIAVGNPDDWDQNVTIQVHDMRGQGVMSINDLNQMVSVLDRRMPQQYVGFRKISDRIFTLQGRPVLEYDMMFRRMGEQMQCKEYVISRPDKAFIVCCTAKKGAFEALDSRFDLVVTTLVSE